MSSSTSLTVVVPAGTGTVSVTVSTTSGGSSTPLASAYTYVTTASPTVLFVFPNRGPVNGGTRVYIFGTNLTGATAVHFGGNAATGVIVLGRHVVSAISPAGTGMVDIMVTTPGGTSVTSAADRFTYVVRRGRVHEDLPR